MSFANFIPLKPNVMTKRLYLLVFISFLATPWLYAQSKSVQWLSDGHSYLEWVSGTGIMQVEPRKNSKKIIIAYQDIHAPGAAELITPASFQWSPDGKKFLLFTNTAKVWRYETRGDYWVFDLASKGMRPVGKGLPARSLMFAKFSPDSKQLAYVSHHNIYAEDVQSGIVRKLTNDGSRKLINGTFDWVYEEEFGCRDGFRWSPDSKRIAYWQVDAGATRDFYMINNTDSVYSKVIPVEYPKVGEPPSSVRIGVLNVVNGVTKWLKIEGDPRQQYLPRMDWVDGSELIIMQLDRKQQECRLMYGQADDGSVRTFWAENSDTWVDVTFDEKQGWTWINNKAQFLWTSEKDGWRHIYQISRDGKQTQLLTKGNYDVGSLKGVDEGNHWLYFTASPDNATQLYLYRVKFPADTKNTKEEKPELVSDLTLKGKHDYDLSPGAMTAFHQFSNYSTYPVSEWISLPDHKPLGKDGLLSKRVAASASSIPGKVEYIRLQTVDGIELDAWIRKPVGFNPAKKYPLVMYVYGEPAASTVMDEFGTHQNFMYDGDMAQDGYVQISIDNRGTPSLKGAAWRKAIYRRNGQVNIRDLAMGVRAFLEGNDYIDRSRVAVWGWSGGGSSTLNLLFQFPDIFQTGISIAPVTNLLYYDNIYTERYMGLPSENREDYIKGSPITHAHGLQGNLLLIHGTGDDNVHYSNAEALVNELVKHNKQFQFMPYPNRTHNISEGEGTWAHFSTLYTAFLKRHCPPGAR